MALYKCLISLTLYSYKTIRRFYLFYPNLCLYSTSTSKALIQDTAMYPHLIDGFRYFVPEDVDDLIQFDECKMLRQQQRWKHDQYWQFGINTDSRLN